MFSMMPKTLSYERYIPKQYRHFEAEPFYCPGCAHPQYHQQRAFPLDAAPQPTANVELGLCRTCRRIGPSLEVGGPKGEPTGGGPGSYRPIPQALLRAGGREL